MAKEEKKFIVKERHFIVKDIIAFMPDVDRKTLRGAIKNMWDFIRYDHCPYCHAEIVIMDRNRQQVYCCPEHKKAYNNKHRAKTRTAVCEYCGEQFTTYSFRKTRYCSPWCAANHRAELMKKEKEKDQEKQCTSRCATSVGRCATGVRLYQNCASRPINKLNHQFGGFFVVTLMGYRT